MFKSYRVLNFTAPIQIAEDLASPSRYTVEIVDDDFTEIIDNTDGLSYEPGFPSHLIAVIKSIILIYSRKNLDVARNLFCCMLMLQSSHWFYNIDWQMKTLPIYCNEMNVYLPELKKYLLFT